MKQGLTEIVTILDMSGSMESMRDDTIGGYNAILHENRGDDANVLVSTYVFNNHITRLHDRVPIAEVKDITAREYQPGGCTALIDAMGEAIRHTAQIHHYAREEDRPEHTMFVITTDGYENASTHYTADEVRRMVEHETQKYGWEFIYLASNIDAVETARVYGIIADNAVDFVPDERGVRQAMRSAGCVLHRHASPMFRKNISASHENDKEWRKEVDEDFRARSGNSKSQKK